MDRCCVCNGKLGTADYNGLCLACKQGTERQDNDTAKPTTEETTTAKESGEGGMALGLKEAIEYLTKSYSVTRDIASTELNRVLDISIEALREKAARENPQSLTLEELKERRRKPVWIKNGKMRYWSIVDISMLNGTYETVCQLSSKDYGKTWLAYDHEPKL